MAAERYAVFLRAINVGKRRVKKVDLVSAFEVAGYTNVDAFLASGNVILDSEGSPDPRHLSRAVKVAFGFDSEAFVRSSSELASILHRNPWQESDALVEVSLLERPADTAAARELERAVSPPEELIVSGAEVFFLRQGKGIDTIHKEATTARLLDRVTTRRGMRTIRDIHARFFAG